jgi:hypothetical protein
MPGVEVFFSEPAPGNDYLLTHAERLIRSYHHWTGSDLIAAGLPPLEAAIALYHAPFVVLSHDTDADPRFTYANLAAQACFEMTWPQIVSLPSRLSAEPMEREARERFLEQVAAHGYIDDYRGVRVAKSGRRFLIQAATVWNLLDAEGHPIGQAATFSETMDLAAR